MATRKLSNNDRVLVALSCAAGNTTAPVAYEEIVVESWKKYPERYALRNYPHFPDSADQNKPLYGDLKKRGYVVPLGDRFFRLTETGLERAIGLQKALPDRAPADSVRRLSRSESRLIRRATASEAYAKWSAGQTDEIVDFDARAFFGVSVTMAQLDRRVCADGMSEAMAAAVEGGLPIAPHLRELAEFLVERFPEVVGLPSNEEIRASA